MKSFTCSIFQSFYVCVFSRLDLKESTGKANAANTTLSAQPHTSLHSGTSPETESVLGHWVFLSYWKSRSLPRDVENTVFVSSNQAWSRNKWEIFVSGISHVKLVFLLQIVNMPPNWDKETSLVSASELTYEPQESQDLWSFAWSASTAALGFLITIRETFRAFSCEIFHCCNL